MAERTVGKAERLLQIEHLLLAHPAGLTQAEIARRTGVNRSTISRSLPELTSRFAVYETDDGRLAIDRDRYLTHVRLTVHEAMAVHLATRLLAAWSDKHNPHAGAALRKLGQALERLAPRVARHLVASADVMDGAAQRQDAAYLRVLETLTRAWSDGQMTRVWHHLDDGRVFEYDFAPYFVEPYLWGHTSHTIGLRRPPGEVRTFKLERIQRIELLPERYEIPATFDPRTYLASAWGIWTGEKPQEVILRFHPRVRARVLETRWHRDEHVEEREDGSVIWRAPIAEPREMLPWIRGWGADVEVLVPTELRDELVEESRRLARLYSVVPGEQDATLDRLLHCWGKTGKAPWEFHPALFHMVDVGHVARELLSEQASPRWRRVLAEALGTDPVHLVRWLPWIVALHDIGKLSAAFQAQNAEQKQRLLAEGFDFGKVGPTNRLHHTVLGRLVLADALAQALPERLAESVLAMIGGHHGRYNRDEYEDEAAWRVQREPEAWGQLRRRAVEILASHLRADDPALPEPENISAAIALLNGFTILCDWLGSNEEQFKATPFLSLPEYVALSRRRARDCVAAAGFLVPTRSETAPRFAALFPGWSVRPLQAAAEQIPEPLLHGPSLTIAEAPTGEGKTEFGLTLERRIAALRGTDEMYVALPTMATSNAMYPRIQEHLRDRLGLDPALVKLIHGQDFLIEDDLRIEPLDSGDGTTPPSLAWFSPKKRALVAPFGVGTIDQAMYAALNTHHNALRLVGLAGKTVILDEIHAYDTYMTTIVERLLEWLAQSGASVILLSATLPTRRRQRLLEAFAGRPVPLDETLQQAYPSVITVGPAGTTSAHLTPTAQAVEEPTHLQFLNLDDDQAAEKADWLLEQVEAGGCACWIANTVKRAQQIFEALGERAGQEVRLTLLHARFPLEDRQKREKEVLDLYGKEGQRPARGIVVGTQVLEQSLDLDFDVMASDHAPIDLLLQREGRLHRHARPERPAAHRTPRLYVNAVRDADDRLLLGDDRFYDEYVLRRSWHVLRARTELHLPTDYRPLIEAVYDEAPPESPELKEAYARLEADRHKQREEAAWRVVGAPDPDQPFCNSSSPVFDEDEESAAWIMAQTRLGQESVTVIPLERQGDQARLVPLDETVAIDRAASREVQLRLLKRSLRLSQPSVVQALKPQSAAERTPLFTDSPLLRHVQPLWLTAGRAELCVGGKTLTVVLDPQLGLQFIKEEA